MRGSNPLCERAAESHSTLPWDGSGVSWELLGEGYRAHQCEYCCRPLDEVEEVHRSSSNNCKKPHVHRAWSLWGTLTTPISAGRTVQHSSSKNIDIQSLNYLFNRKQISTATVWLKTIIRETLLECSPFLWCFAFSSNTPQETDVHGCNVKWGNCEVGLVVSCQHPRFLTVF